MSTKKYLYIVGLVTICLFGSFRSNSKEGKVNVYVYMDTCLHSPLHVSSLPDKVEIRVLTAGQQVAHPVKKFDIGITPSAGGNSFFYKIYGHHLSAEALKAVKALKPGSLIIVGNLELADTRDFIVRKGGLWKVAE